MCRTVEVATIVTPTQDILNVCEGFREVIGNNSLGISGLEFVISHSGEGT